MTQQTDNTKSKGHECFLGKWEYFISVEGLYRAPSVFPLNRDGYRSGGRLQAPIHLAQSTLEWHKEAFK